MSMRLVAVALLLTSRAFSFSPRVGAHRSSRFARADTFALFASAREMDCPTIPLRDGTPHPAISFGTYKVGFIPASASSAVAAPGAETVQRMAEECAEFYGNEAEIGKAIAGSGIPRAELHLCSKVWTTTIEKGGDAIRAQLEKTLSDLGTDYLDLYLVHWPVPNKH